MDAVLDPVRHERLLMDKAHILAMANIPESVLNTSMVGLCTEAQIDWVRKFHSVRKLHSGVVLTGSKSEQAMLMTGALIRNFVDARVITLDVLLGLSEGDHAPDPTVMVVPNFFQRSYGKTLPAWKVSLLYDILLKRKAGDRQTILVIEEADAMAAAYGPAIREHVAHNFVLL